MTTLTNDKMQRDSAVHDGAMIALDRCDACDAQTYAHVEMPYRVLVFCGHHANAHLGKLAASTISMCDERERIG